MQQLISELEASPTIKAKSKLRTKNDILELCERQFSTEGTRKSSMFGRAMQIYAEHKERTGVRRNDILKPDTVAHFHIDAFGDGIECNRYE